VKRGEFVNGLGDCHLLMKDCAPHSVSQSVSQFVSACNKLLPKQSLSMQSAVSTMDQFWFYQTTERIWALFVPILYNLTPWSRVLRSLQLSSSLTNARLLWKTKVHYCVHNIPPLVPVLSQMNFSKIHSSIFMFLTFRGD
jgi:hypothetical protein